MPYKQVKPFNTEKGGDRPGFCLQNVRLGFSIPGKYDSAWEAWQHTQKHGNRLFPRLDVPLFYDYTDKLGNRYGHINVRLANGQVWNDGRLFSSLVAFENAWGNVKYVGWGESVNDVLVVKQVESSGGATDMYKGKDAKYWYDKYQEQLKVTKHHQTKRKGLVDKLKQLIGGK